MWHFFIALSRFSVFVLWLAVCEFLCKRELISLKISARASLPQTVKVSAVFFTSPHLLSCWSEVFSLTHSIHPSKSNQCSRSSSSPAPKRPQRTEVTAHLLNDSLTLSNVNLLAQWKDKGLVYTSHRSIKLSVGSGASPDAWISLMACKRTCPVRMRATH